MVVPAYNAELWLPQTIQSVVGQTYNNWELLIVDDGSTDGTLGVASSWAAQDRRIRLFSQSNQGVAAARNLGIRQARGEFFAPLDADDMWYPTKLARQLELFQRSSCRLGLVYCWWQSVDYQGILRPYKVRWSVAGPAAFLLLFQNFIGNASVPLVPLRVARELGGYDTSLRASGGQGCEDWDFNLRLAERYEIDVVPEILVAYRDVGSGMSNNTESMARSFEKVLRNTQKRNSNLPRGLVNWSRSNFYSYLAGKSYASRDFRNAIRHSWEILRRDPAFAVSPWLIWVIFASCAREGVQCLHHSVSERSALAPAVVSDHALSQGRKWARNCAQLLNPLKPVFRIMIDRRWDKIVEKLNAAPPKDRRKKSRTKRRSTSPQVRVATPPSKSIF